MILGMLQWAGKGDGMLRASCHRPSRTWDFLAEGGAHLSSLCLYLLFKH